MRRQERNAAIEVRPQERKAVAESKPEIQRRVEMRRQRDSQRDNEEP